MLNRLLRSDIDFLLSNVDVTNLVLHNNNTNANLYTDIMITNITKYKFINSAKTFIVVNYKGYVIRIDYPDDWPFGSNTASITPPNGVPIDYASFVISTMGAAMVWNNLTTEDSLASMNELFKAIDTDIETKNEGVTTFSPLHPRPPLRRDAQPPVVASILEPPLVRSSLALAPPFYPSSSSEGGPPLGGGRRVKKRKTKKRKYTKRRK